MSIFDPGIEPISVQEMYDDASISDDQLDALLGRSLNPRPSSMLYDKLAALGVQHGHVVLDIGCRNAAHTCEIARRFNCRCIGIDPVAGHVDRAATRVRDSSLTDRITIQQGMIDSIPLADASIDFIWCRDVLSHVRDLRAGLAECRRVLRPGGGMVAYQTFATPHIEPREAAWLYAALAVEPGSMNPAHFEQAALAVGFEIVERDPIDSEWREHWEETGERITSNQLLRIARMRRDRDRLLRELGRIAYIVELANGVWGVYQMLGKLCPTVYVLRAFRNS